MEGAWLRFALRVWAVGILLFLFIPIGLVIVYAFNVSTIQSWPIPGVTLRWFGQTWQDPEVRRALLLSVEAGLMATAVALVLGSMAAFAIHRFQFFGREVISFALVLPLALPGIITGMSLNSFFAFNQVTFSLWTIVIGHATFCIVIVYNNVLARLRRTSSSLMEAAMDLGASGWQTFWHVTLPSVKWGLIYGIILCNARAMGEFGAVYVVSGHIAGKTDTMPLRVEKLFQEYNLPGAFALASVLAMLALVTLFAKTALEWKTRRDLAEAARLAAQGGEP